MVTKPNVGQLTNQCKIDIFYLFPGFSRDLLRQRLLAVDALVIVSYGLGNAPTDDEFLQLVATAVQAGTIVAYCSQCPHNLAEPSIYAAGKKLAATGAINLYDMTLAAAIFKIIYLSSSNLSSAELRLALPKNLCGEIGLV
jgi:L-asparaginase